jgi:hypothetical protein
VVESGNEGPHEQHNHGSGPFIGRDNFGNIRYELLDPKTKIVLAKLSTDAPALAKLLTTALRDGVISPDVVAALESAVRNINEDVASSLRLAGQNINEDVAWSLRRAGENINEDVADKLLRAANTLSEARRGLDHAVEQVNYMGGGRNLDHLIGLAGTITDAAERIESVVTPPPARIIVDWTARFKAFLWGAGIGILTGAILIYYLIKR